MPVTDPIADMLTGLRNGTRSHKDRVDIKNSRIHREILGIFKEEGYIKNFRVVDDKKQGMIRIYLKFEEGKKSVITNIRRISKPGLRVYAGKDRIPRVLRGLGTAVLSTSKGIMTDKKARREKIGGEVVCYIW